jgi:hypothetical protein
VHAEGVFEESMTSLTCNNANPVTAECLVHLGITQPAPVAKEHRLAVRSSHVNVGTVVIRHVGNIYEKLYKPYGVYISMEVLCFFWNVVARVRPPSNDAVQVRPTSKISADKTQ